MKPDPGFRRVDYKHYVTGPSALNFPSSLATGDWRRLNYFDVFAKSYEIFIAGINFPDTSEYFGNEGIMEVSGLLIEMGIKPGKTEVWMADHYRAAADSVVSWAMSKNQICTVEVNEYFPGFDQRNAFVDLLLEAKEGLMQDGLWNKIDVWLAEQLKEGLA